MIKVIVNINYVILLLSKLCNFRLLGVPNNPCGLTGMLNVDEGVVLVDSILKILQAVLQIQNARFIHAFLLSSVRTAFLFQNASPMFLNNARSVSSAGSMFYQLQNARPAFCLS